ncbi:MAG: amidohydrolase family protein [Chthoniobacterales bacterium]|nr:amidohydrolase family protein [Chthoniobacterales bacterium]
MPTALRIDMHVHMVGNGVAGSGGWLRLSGWHRWLAGFMIKQLGFPREVLDQDLESVYAQHLLGLVRDSSLDAAVLLAHERVHDPDGTPRDDLGTMYVPNDVVLDLADAHPEFLAGVSIHPARQDAIAELNRCIERGAVLMKCLPNCQNIDPSDARYRRFWERMAETRLPLLAHTGGEHSVKEVNPRLADPKLLRLPLECGVTVIAAHCATKSGPTDRDFFEDWAAMLSEFPRLYGDISAMVSLNRCGHLQDCLRPEIEPRILHGSDFPVPVLGHRLWMQGALGWSEFRRIQKIKNPLERDWQFKHALGFQEEVRTRAASLLRTKNVAADVIPSRRDGEGSLAG